MFKPKINLKDGTIAVVFPDIHTPRHHVPSVKAALSYLKELRKKNKPDIFIQLGDLCDFDSLSRFQVINSKDMVSLIDEIRSANELLDEIDSILPKHCQKIITFGNHDKRPELYRLNNWDSKDQKLFGKSFGYERIPNADVLYKLKERGWKWVDYGDTVEIGKAVFTHGWYVNKWHTEKTLTKWFRTIIYGHVHNWQVCNRNGMDGNPVAAMCIGTLSRLDLSYLKGVPPDWMHLFMQMNYFADGTFTPLMIPIVNGRFIMDGVVYGKN